MAIYQNYNLIFFNKVVNNIVIKTVSGNGSSSILFTPLSEYLYTAGHSDAIDEIILDINKFLNNEPLQVGLEVGTETVSINSNIITITNDDGRIQNIPILDMKQILSEYKSFLNTPPLNGTKVL